MRQKIFSWRHMLPLVAFFLMFISADPIWSQSSISIRGQVIDAGNQEPLIGVSIQEKGTGNGVITDMDGKFSIQVNKDATLVFSYIGYKTANLKALQANGIVKLQEDAATLQEVVVVGYGTQKKVNLSGSVSAIEGDKIAARPASNAVAALQGELPGVSITRNSGQPGSETGGMQIRGASSVNTTSTLILIDGIEGDLALVNPNDIESISVLKDAASCAIYGARAAAGVVLVTTKNGTEGKPRISYNGYCAFNTPGNMPERLTAWEEQSFINQSRIPTTGKVEWNEEKSSWIGNPNFNSRPLKNGRWDLFEATNWVAEGTKKHTTQQSHSLSVSGGGKQINYLLSANFYTKNGLLKYGTDSNDRYNLLAKINASINQYIDLGLNVQYQSTEVKQPSYGSTGLFYLLYSSRGRQSVYNPEGDESGNIYNGDLQANAIDLMKNGGTNYSKYEAFTGKFNLTVKDLIKGLKLTFNASRKAGYYLEQNEKRTLYWKDRFGKAIRNSYAEPNELYKKKNSDYHDLAEATINYTFQLMDQTHNFNLLAGTSYERYHKDEMFAKANNMNSNDFFSFNYYDSSVNTNTSIGDYIGDWKMMSYFGRINYNFRELYLLEANVRYDGSSRLAPSKRWKAFPSVSAAWRINEESWFKVEWISQLKLRASWGQLGNGAILGLYDYIPLITDRQNNMPNTYMGEKWFYQADLASKDKTWETIETTNIGVDFGLFNNRLNGSFEYYWKINNDMLSSLQLPHQIGINVPKMNIGKLRT